MSRRNRGLTLNADQSKQQRAPPLPCPFCHMQEQGVAIGRPDISAPPGSHEPVCLLRELAQYPPKNSGSEWWQRYLVVVSREMPPGLPPTERAKRLIDASAGARDVLERTDRVSRLHQ